MATATYSDHHFSNYKVTEEESFQEGFLRGFEWPKEANWVPGGPHVNSIGHYRDEAWIAFCKKQYNNREKWLEGWHAGKAAREAL